MWLAEGMVWSERKQWTNSFGWKCHYRRRIEPSLPPVGEGFRRIDPAVDVPQEGDEIWLIRHKQWHARWEHMGGFNCNSYYRRRVEPPPLTISLFVPARAFDEPFSDFPVRCSLRGVTDVASWVKVAELRKVK